jgi:uncharacterized RDD family membrane protein YckC
MEENPKYDTFWRRFVAYLLDKLIVLFPIAYIGTTIPNKSHADTLLFVLISTITWASYRIIMHSRTGQTIGKLMTKIIVLDKAEHKLPGLFKILKRELLPLTLPCIGILYVVLFLPVDTTFDIYMLNAEGELVLDKIDSISKGLWDIVAAITILFNDTMMGPHDQFAGTIVVKKEVWEEEYRNRQKLM